MFSHAMRAIPPGWAGILPTKQFAVGHARTVGMWITGDEVVRIQDGRGLLLCVKHGSAWVTEAGSIKDVVIEAGDSFRLERDGCTLVSRGAKASNAVLTLTRSHSKAPLQDFPRSSQTWVHRIMASAGLRGRTLGGVAQ